MGCQCQARGQAILLSMIHTYSRMSASVFSPSALLFASVHVMSSLVPSPTAFLYLWLFVAHFISRWFYASMFLPSECVCVSVFLISRLSPTLSLSLSSCSLSLLHPHLPPLPFHLSLSFPPSLFSDSLPHLSVRISLSVSMSLSLCFSLTVSCLSVSLSQPSSLPLTPAILHPSQPSLTAVWSGTLVPKFGFSEFCLPTVISHLQPLPALHISDGRTISLGSRAQWVTVYDVQVHN